MRSCSVIAPLRPPGFLASWLPGFAPQEPVFRVIRHVSSAPASSHFIPHIPYLFGLHLCSFAAAPLPSSPSSPLEQASPLVALRPTLPDTAFIIAQNGFAADIKYCLFLCKDTYSDGRLLGEVVNQPFGPGTRALLEAASSQGRHTRAVQLLDAGAHVDGLGTSCTPLLRSIWEGHSHEPITRLLLSRGAAINGPPDSSATSPLQTAIQMEREPLAAFLIKQGAGIHGFDYYGKTALHNACARGLESVARLLLTHGADAMVTDAKHHYRTPLAEACEEGHEPIARLLIEHGCADGHHDSSRRKPSPLHWVCKAGFESCVHLLLERGARSGGVSHVHATDNDKMAPLHWACKHGREAAVRLLLDVGGADVNAQDKEQRTGLHYACDEGHEPIARLLLQRGANVHVKDYCRNTPMHIACMAGNASLALLLLEHGADAEGMLHLTCGYGRGEAVARLLLDRGANVNQLDDGERTPLHKACASGDEATVRLLIERGAKLSVVSVSLDTPLYLAQRGELDGSTSHAAIVKLLLSLGATIGCANCTNA